MDFLCHFTLIFLYVCSSDDSSSLSSSSDQESIHKKKKKEIKMKNDETPMVFCFLQFTIEILVVLFMLIWSFYVFGSLISKNINSKYHICLNMFDLNQLKLRVGRKSYLNLTLKYSDMIQAV